VVATEEVVCTVARSAVVDHMTAIGGIPVGASYYDTSSLELDRAGDKLIPLVNVNSGNQQCRSW
jgi:hypothetical protein